MQNILSCNKWESVSSPLKLADQSFVLTKKKLWNSYIWCYVLFYASIKKFILCSIYICLSCHEVIKFSQKYRAQRLVFLFSTKFIPMQKPVDHLTVNKLLNTHMIRKPTVNVKMVILRSLLQKIYSCARGVKICFFFDQEIHPFHLIATSNIILRKLFSLKSHHYFVWT